MQTISDDMFCQLKCLSLDSFKFAAVQQQTCSNHYDNKAVSSCQDPSCSDTDLL